MKFRIPTVMILLVIASTIHAQEYPSTQLAFKDFSITSKTMNPLSVGPCLWIDPESDQTIGGVYVNAVVLSTLHDYLRTGVGLAVTLADVPFKLRPCASLSTRLFHRVEFGIWGAFFFGLTRYEDPFGLFVGYTF